jgi:hypothetical protein
MRGGLEVLLLAFNTADEEEYSAGEIMLMLSWKIIGTTDMGGQNE